MALRYQQAFDSLVISIAGRAQPERQPLTVADIGSDIDAWKEAIAAKDNRAVISTVASFAIYSAVAQVDNIDAALGAIYTILDITLVCSEKDLCGRDTAFGLIEELVDSQTIEGCSKIFDYLESRKERLAKDLTGNRGAGMILLRFSNELLRRLSKAEDTVFCGRVTIFLARVFPLVDRSGVNLRGDYNVGNVTLIDNDNEREAAMNIDDAKPDVPAVEDGSEEERKVLDEFYPIFWSLQERFSNPPSLYKSEDLAAFEVSLGRTLAKLREIEDAQRKLRGDTGTKSDRKDSGSSERSEGGMFNPKFLSSRKLLKLELEDSSFRRHILVQTLILLDHFLSLSPEAKAKLTALKTPNKSVLPTFTPSEEELAWMKDMRKEAADIIKRSSPNGEGFLADLEGIMDRDKNWLNWKLDSCYAFGESPIPSETIADASTKLKKSTEGLRPYMHSLGTPTLTKLWKTGSGFTLEDLSQPKRHTVPEAESFIKGIEMDKFESEMATQDEEKMQLLEAKASKNWRALRIAAKTKLQYFDKIGEGNVEMIEEAIKKQAELDEPAKDGGAGEEAKKKVEDEKADTAMLEVKAEVIAGENTSTESATSVVQSLSEKPDAQAMGGVESDVHGVKRSLDENQDDETHKKAKMEID
ncbi:hypothetical protein SAICODRAFT_93464 [Saitoella complicata NRRL Y-17804]|uniref:THO complex subunit 1 n=1 Tax=Saitoella complicata (strain BCRC 22490 / CBS 7301 / JCM 7358 / NBRC 10748 / NRRL Y-17804) TaxID=698492 RepID=A0A0E9NCD1_SAICN|nr:uncharacterized protein SAICODRAFT_93464 [Saitoella complicata NRRL Y-17804]ODQ52544.1 hypothetical protein SAICODRAFT_93464 [Saitoella complicata NRRL Y-17804]GAO47489.1 hypothetical protein G7K_1695-t1 [Saitoella complicata NRRL Y-17804]